MAATPTRSCATSSCRRRSSSPTTPRSCPANLKPYAGEQVDTAKEAKVFANDYIGLHLKGIAKGQTYSEVSGQFMKDPNNQQLAQQRQTLFMGETLRGMLLSAWGWGTVGTVATIAGVVLDRPRRPAARRSR